MTAETYRLYRLRHTKSSVYRIMTCHKELSRILIRGREWASQKSNMDKIGKVKWNITHKMKQMMRTENESGSMKAEKETSTAIDTASNVTLVEHTSALREREREIEREREKCTILPNAIHYICFFHCMKSEFLCSLWQCKESFMPFMANCK